MASDFSGQKLQGQPFKGQDLHKTDFSGADIHGVDFSNAILVEATFAQAKLALKPIWSIGLRIGLAISAALEEIEYQVVCCLGLR